jgi:hypothetical protein
MPTPLTISHANEDVLSRLQYSRQSLNSSSSQFQTQADQLTSVFIDQASDPKMLLSMGIGGWAYRIGKISVLSSGAWVLSRGGLASSLLRAGSALVGLASEVTSFEFANRSLDSLLRATGRSPQQDLSPNLWSWSGPNGWKQALLNDTFTFGILKGAGYLSRESNIVFQHAFSSSALVAGRSFTEVLSLDPEEASFSQAPTLAERFLHAEITNLQMSAGNALMNGLAPSLVAWEKSLEFFSAENLGGNLSQKWKGFLGATMRVEPLLTSSSSTLKAPEFPPREFMMGNREDSNRRIYGGRGFSKDPISLARMQSIIYRLPEISKALIPELVIGTPYGKIVLKRLERFNSLGQLTRKIQSTALPESLARDFEDILWEFEPPTDHASLDQLENNAEQLSRRVFEFYLQNRDVIYSLSEEPTLDWKTVREKEEDSFAPFWELKSIPESRIFSYQASTPVTFKYFQSSKEPLWMVRFRVPGQDMNRILVTQKILNDIEREIQTGGQFAFQPPKERPGAIPFVLTKDNYLGAFPATPFTRMQLGAEVLFSTSLFKATFGLMDYIGVHESEPLIADEINKEMRRMAALLLLGAEEKQVMDTFRKRILKKYYQNRESFIQRMDFLRYDENFVFLPQFSPHIHILSPELRGTFFRFINDKGVALHFNAESVFVLGMLRRIYQTGDPHLIHQLIYQASDEEPAEIPHWVARFYFEHQSEILNLLKDKGQLN